MEHDEATPQQLTLLPPSDVPLRFRLDQDTRRRGLQHIAEIRHLLAERRAMTTGSAAEQAERRPVRGRAA
jgi:hypothetical protein